MNTLGCPKSHHYVPATYKFSIHREREKKTFRDYLFHLRAAVRSFCYWFSRQNLQSGSEHWQIKQILTTTAQEIMSYIILRYDSVIGRAVISHNMRK